MDHLVDIKTWQTRLTMDDLVFPTLQNIWIQGSHLAQLHTKALRNCFSVTLTQDILDEPEQTLHSDRRLMWVSQGCPTT